MHKWTPQPADLQHAIQAAVERGEDADACRFFEQEPNILRSLGNFAQHLHRIAVENACPALVQLLEREGVNATEFSAALTGADPDRCVRQMASRDHLKRTPLHYACMGGQTTLVQLLISAGASSSRDRLDMLPISYAVQRGHAEIVRRLAIGVAQAPLDMLIDAAGSGSVETTALILNKCRNPFEPGLLGRNALAHAAGRGHEGVVEFLLKRAPRPLPSDTDIDGKRSLHAALRYPTIALLFLEAGYAHDVWSLSAIGTPEAITLWLRNCPSDARARTGAGEEPVHFAAFAGNTRAIAALSQHGADLATQSSYGGAAGHLAAREGHAETMIELIRCGLSITARDRETGETLLHAACRSGSLHTIREALAGGIEPEAFDSSQETALHYAARENRADVWNELLAYGLSAHSKNRNGETPLDVAVTCGSLAVLSECLR
jgi:ankyrin repeat protein